MNYQTKVKYSGALVSMAAWKYWMKKHGHDAVISVVVLLGAAYFLVIQKAMEWYVGFFLAVGVIYVVAVYGGFLAVRRSALKSLRAMGAPEATWAFSDESVMCESGVGKAEIKWTSIERLLRFNDVWLLVLANGAYTTLPVAQVPPEARAFIEARVKSAGGRVI